jgi:hypothetical protein
MIAVKAIWIGLAVLFLVLLLMAVAIVSWHHVTGASLVHLLGFVPKDNVTTGC